MDYQDLVPLSGENCYTLTIDSPAKMYVEKDGIVIVYPSGNTVDIPRAIMEKAIRELKNRGQLTVDDVHEGITQRNRTRTDKLMAVIRMLPGVTFDRKPRVLYFDR